MSLLRVSYLALSVGLMSFGAILAWLGLRRPPALAGTPLRLVLALLMLLAIAGAAAAVVLEARAARPF